jgi:hypothetical protein
VYNQVAELGFLVPDVLVMAKKRKIKGQGWLAYKK